MCVVMHLTIITISARQVTCHEQINYYEGQLAKIDNPSAHKASGKLCVCVVIHVIFKKIYAYCNGLCIFCYRYFTQGFPVVMFTHLIPFAFGVYKASPRQKNLAWLILWTIIVYRFGVTNTFDIKDNKCTMYHAFFSFNFLLLGLLRKALVGQFHAYVRIN